MNAEVWKDIPSFPGYQASDRGRVRSLRRSRPWVMKPHPDDGGYLRLRLITGISFREPRVHQLVAEAFHGPCLEGLECRHLNGDKLDNRSANLRWGTRSENQFDRVSHGTHQGTRKTHCPREHPYDTTNTRVARGRRRCLICERAHTRAYRKRRRAIEEAS